MAKLLPGKAFLRDELFYVTGMLVLLVGTPSAASQATALTACSFIIGSLFVL